jgi:hypothetical protein
LGQHTKIISERRQFSRGTVLFTIITKFERRLAGQNAGTDRNILSNYFLFDEIVALAINVKFYNGRKATQDITEMQVENKIL